MDRFAHAVIVSWGWRRRGIAFAAGALSSLAMAPFFAFPVLWLTFPTLVFLLDGAVGQGRRGRVRRLAPAFATGWWFGFGYFLAGLWWIGAAFLVEAEEFAWLMPLAVIALPAGLALFWGLGTAFAQLFWSDDWRRIFALAVGLGGAEWLRGHVLSGFPWNAIGYALTAGEILMQSAALFGIYGLGVIAVVVFAAPAAMATTGQARHRQASVPAFGLAVLAALALHGAIRLSQADTGFAPGVAVRIVQPALDQLQKWNPANRDEVLATYYRLSATEEAPLLAGTLLVWPESAFPFALTEEPAVLAAIADLLPAGVTLATGAYRMERLPPGERRTFNSIYLIGEDGTILEAYDKRHLVPFGEYLPAADILASTGLRQLAWSGFSPGPRRHDMSLPDGRSLAPLICYEAIFPGAVLPPGARPDFLLNVTNDGWFGRTIGPYQHFHQARVRSVEEGLPLVRAANTGISAIVDPYGRVVAQAGLGAVATIDSKLPLPIAAPFYARWNDLAFVLSLAVSLLVTVSGIVHPLYRPD